MSEQTTHNTKRLLILRHALATSSTSSDAARPLAPQGKEDAIALGAYMKAQNLNPDLVLCSTATRTRQTLDGLKQHLPLGKTQFLDILYSGTTGDYLYEIQKVKGNPQTILILAHNPSIYELAVLLCGYGIDSHMQRLSEGYKPATLTVLECNITDWSDLSPAMGKLTDIKDPLDYNAPARPTRWM